MSRLKSRTGQIPNGLKFVEPLTGWDSMKAIGSHPSFDRLVSAVQQHRVGNPRFKAKWKTDPQGVATDVENYNVRLCETHGWTEYLAESTFSPPPKMMPPRKLAGAAVGAVSKSSTAIKLVVEWLGSGLQPVKIDLANKRAAVCAVCPKNEDGGFFEKIGALAARDVRALIEVKNDLSLKTQVEDKLKSCSACSCWLPLKVFVPGDLVQKNTDAETRAKLDKACWILSEANEIQKG